MDRPSNSMQLDLWGPEPGAVAQAPWGGRSPRVLTAAYVRFTLKAQAEKSMGDFVDPEQYDFWMPIQKAPWIYQGAPLLLGLEEG